MRTDELSTESLRSRIDSIVGRVQFVFRQETGRHYDDRLIADAMHTCVQRKLEKIEDDLLEMFTSPHYSEFSELEQILEERSPIVEAAVEVEEMAELAREFGDESVFAGFRVFSKPKLAAMMQYLTSKGHHVYKTNLNKLLFYSDMSYFYLRGVGISGSMYLNRPYGPVSDPAAPVLAELVAAEAIEILPGTQTLAAKDAQAAEQVLSDDERRLLDWVAETYGRMSASEISDFSHREMAYKFTEANEPIAYAYSKFFKHLPPKGLLDN